MSTERVTFPGADGDRLAARLELPPGGRPRALALFAHCFTCTKNIRAAVNITRGLASRGIGVLRFDFTGLGESEGDFADTTFGSNVEDVVAAAQWLAEEHSAPGLLVGHSLGGAAVLHAALQLPSVRAVATIGAPSEPTHVLRHLEGSIEEIEREGEASVLLAGRPFRIRKKFLEDLDRHRMSAVLRELDRALLVMHAPTDATVGIDNAAEIYQAARHPKSFVSLDDADHLLSRPADSAYVADVLAAWATRYLTPAIADEQELADPDRAITRTRAGSFFTEVEIREHSLVADEPASVGGEDAGPTPYDYLLAGLGSCTSMTLGMYARRKEWPLEAAIVRLRHEKVHARDCEDCESEDSRIDHIEREVELVGPLDEEQRSRLLEIANRCPVHRTLDAGIRITTSARSRAEASADGQAEAEA